MNYFAIQSLFSSFMILFIGIYVIEKNPRSPLNRLFSLIALLTSYHSFVEFGYRSAVNIDTALFWHKFSSVWPFTVALGLHLILIFTDKKKILSSPFGYVSIYVPPFLLSIAEYYSITFTDSLVLEPWGWVRQVHQITLYTFRNFFWMLAVLSIELTICLKYLKNSTSKQIKKQGRYFVLGLIVPLVFLSINGIVLSKLSKVPDLTTFSILLSVLFLAYGIVRHQLFKITPERIAQDIISNMNAAFFLIDSNRSIVMVNKTTTELFGEDENQFIGKPFDHVLSGKRVKSFLQLNILESLIANDYIQNVETGIKTEFGRVIPVAISGFAERDKKGTPIGYVVMIRDISKIKKTEGKLIASEEKYRILLESVMEGYYEVDLSGRYVFVNDAYCQITGYSKEDLVGMSYRELTTEETANKLFYVFNSIFKSGASQKDIRFHLVKKNKVTVIVETSATLIKDKNGQPTGFSGLTRDASKKAQIEEMLVQSEKMMTLGGLAAGIAHEIKSPLSAIIGSIQLIEKAFLIEIEKNKETANSCGFNIEMLKDYLEQKRIPKKLDLVMNAGLRIDEIIKNILSFSRKGNSIFSKQNLPDLLDRTVSLVASEYDLKKKYSFHDITVNKHYDEDIPLIPCEGSKIQQVFFNLLKNGAQAMAENDPYMKPRKLDLRIKKTNDYIQIEIEDNGQGMDKETCEHIFEPFFTTKISGTGLGLSISNYIIATNHNGTMKVESEPEKGTKFTIALPFYQEKIGDDNLTCD